MSIKLMIEAVRDESPSDLGKHFHSVVAEKLSEGMTSIKRDVVAEMFNVEINEEDDDNEQELDVSEEDND